ncbi:MAG: PAS domain S-box protein [Methanospirillaceae archaeon]|nr:PAS domain S-box protein [Methanospirillaceae archaeon]
MKDLQWIFFFLLFITVVIATFADMTPTSGIISGNTPLLFLGNENIAPVIYVEDNITKGVAVDLVNALAPYLSQEIEIKAMNWSEAQSLVAQGSADALIQINPTEERLKMYDFSDNLLESRFSIFTRSDTIGLSDISSLRGKRVGVESKGLPIQIIKKDPDIIISPIPDFYEGFRQLHNGTLDAVVVDDRVGSYILSKNNIRDVKISGAPIASSYSKIAVRKGNTKLLHEINHALQVIRNDGTYQKIIDTWRPTEGVFQTQQQITEGYYRVIIFILILLFIIAVIWVGTIRRELTGRKTAEKIAKEQYSTLRDIINSTNTPIFSIDRTYRYTSFNRAHAVFMKESYGADIENGKCIFDYISVPQDPITKRDNLDQALSGKEYVIELYSGTETESRQFFQVTYTPVRSGDEIIGVAVFAHDITDRKRGEDELEMQVRERTAQLLALNKDLTKEIAERKQREKDLRESEERYHAIYDQSPIAIELYDEDGALVDVNPACLDLFGVRDIDSIRTFSLFSDPNLSDENKEKLRQGESTHYPVPFDFGKVKVNNLYPTSREGIIWLDVLITPLGGKPDDSTGFLVQVQDITQRKQAEEALQESEKRYRDMFEINNAVMFIIDPRDGCIIDANTAAIRYYGYTHEELTQMRICEINVADPDSIRKDMDHAVEKKGAVFLFKHRKRDGDIRDVEVFSGPISVKGKKFLHSIIQDVTERNQIEEALRQANHKLNLLSSITRHDINNEIQIILGYLELVKESELNPEIRTYIGKVFSSTDNIKRQIAFTRDYEDIGVHTPVWQDLCTVITKAGQLIDISPIQVHVDMSGVEIFADPLLQKVFYNLIDNARRYGETLTEIRFSGWERDEGYTIICEDNGVGIPDEFKTKIFRREYFKHTGFGLNLSREILDITGIVIEETGEFGKGARFEIQVPKGKWRFRVSE